MSGVGISGQCTLMLNYSLVRAWDNTQSAKIGEYLEILQDELLFSKGYYSLIFPALQRISQQRFMYVQGYCQDQSTIKHTVPKHFKINPNPAELMQDECFYSRMSRIQIIVKCNNSLH